MKNISNNIETLMKIGEYSEVISIFEKSMNEPENISDILALAECYRCENKKEALTFFKKALLLDNGEKRIHILHQMGLCYIYIENDIKMALNTFLEIEDKKPSFLVYYIIGYCYYEFKEIEKALFYAEKSFSIEETKEATLLIFYCLTELNKRDRYSKFGNYIAKKYPSYYLSILSAENLIKRDCQKNSFIICSMPKSGTVYIASTLSSLLSRPLFNLMLRQREGLMENLIQNVAKGGVMGNGHISPCTCGFEYFQKYSIDKFIVHTRDPRQTAVSWFFFLEKVKNNYGARPILKQMLPEVYFNWNVETKKEYLVSNLFKQWYSMPEDWYIYQNSHSNANILFTTFEEMRNDSEAFFRQAIEFIGESAEGIDLKSEPEIAKNHHRKGSSNEWHEFWTEDQQRAMHDIIESKVGAFYKWDGFN